LRQLLTNNMFSLLDVSEYFQFFNLKLIFFLNFSATGFMGKMFLERLLSLTNVEKIYLLLRQKRNASPETRLIDLFECAVSVEMNAKIFI
jgi:Male sterility protein